MAEIVNFFMRLKSSVIPSSVEVMEARLRIQPLMKEYWLAEDSALNTVFRELNDSTLNSRVSEMQRLISEYQRSHGRMHRQQMEKISELCLRNARRIVWDTDSGLSEELAPRFAELWSSEMKKLGAFERFQNLYVSDGKSRFISTYPDKPYF